MLGHISRRLFLGSAARLLPAAHPPPARGAEYALWAAQACTQHAATDQCASTSKPSQWTPPVSSLCRGPRQHWHAQPLSQHQSPPSVSAIHLRTFSSATDTPQPTQGSPATPATSSAASPTPADTAKHEKAQTKKAQSTKAAAQPEKRTGAKQSTASTSATVVEEQPLDPVMAWRSSRLSRFNREVLQREMELKLGPLGLKRPPRLYAVDLVISCKDDTRLGEESDKSQLFLHRIALEHLSLGEPVGYMDSPRKPGPLVAGGVSVRLRHQAAYSVLEKVINIALPNQTGFRGIGTPERWLPKYIPKPSKASPNPVPPLDLHYVKIKIMDMLMFHDFEYNFELYESLKSMQVWVWVVDAGNEQVAQLYLTGLGLPAASTQANQYTTTATTA